MFVVVRRASSPLQLVDLLCCWDDFLFVGKRTTAEPLSCLPPWRGRLRCGFSPCPPSYHSTHLPKKARLPSPRLACHYTESAAGRSSGRESDLCLNVATLTPARRPKTARVGENLQGLACARAP